MREASPAAWAVVVTYHPELTGFLLQLSSLLKQCAGVVVVDNGSGPELAAAISSHFGGQLELIELGDNQGIAAAQNAGIALARRNGASHVVLFDHDSQPAPDMVQRLLACWARLTAEGLRVGSVGPCYQDERQSNPPPFIRVRGLRLKRCLVPESEDSVEVDYLIASGCLIPVSVLDDAGGMNEALFIDYVDIEWGLRVRSMGYTNHGCFSARMAHSLGDEPISFLGTAYPARSPLRHYYMFRNAVLLYRMRHIPRDWKIADGLRGILRFGFYALFARPRLSHLKMMLLGLKHGFCGAAGRLHRYP